MGPGPCFKACDGCCKAWPSGGRPNRRFPPRGAARAQHKLSLPDALIAQADSLLRQAADRHDQTATAVAFAARAIVRLADRQQAFAMDPGISAPAAPGAIWLDRL